MQWGVCTSVSVWECVFARVWRMLWLLEVTWSQTHGPTCPWLWTDEAWLPCAPFICVANANTNANISTNISYCSCFALSAPCHSLGLSQEADGPCCCHCCWLIIYNTVGMKEMRGCEWSGPRWATVRPCSSSVLLVPVPRPGWVQGMHQDMRSDARLNRTINLLWSLLEDTGERIW